MELTETIDVNALTRLIRHDGVPDEQKTLLRLYRKQLRDGNKATVKYEHGKEYRKPPTGRVFARGSLGLQSFSREIRAALARDTYWDLDIACAQPSILQNICRQRGWSSDALDDYIANRKAILAEGAAHYDVAPEDIKELFNRALYLGTEEKWRMDVNRASKPQWGRIAAFAKEIQMLAELTVHNFTEERAIANKAKKRDPADTGRDARAGTMSIVLQSAEHAALMAAQSYLSSRGRPFDTLIFDGGLVKKLAGEEDFPAELLEGMNEAVRGATGMTLRWLNKPMEPTSYDLAAVPDLEEWETGQIDDLYAAHTLKKLLGNQIQRDGEVLYVFNPSTGLWECGPEKMRTAAMRHAAQLIFTEEDMVGDRVVKKVHNYGGDVTRMDKMLKLLPSLIADTNFLNRTGDSSKFKLLFNNGIYDFNTGEFTPGFNPEIVFHHRLDRPFPADRDEALIADVDRILFKDGFVCSDDPTNEMGRFYKNIFTYAIAGEYRHKKFYFAIGKSNSGKGVTTDAMKAAFPGYVQTFVTDNLLFNPRNSMDTARKLMWLRDLRTARLMIGNEVAATSDGEKQSALDGNLMNLLSGGGDTLTIRGNHENPFAVKWRTVALVLANDVPPIICDKTAAQTRYKFTEFRKTFKEVADASELGPMEMKADRSLKDRFDNDSDYHDALFWVLADQWRAIKDAGYWEPDCVTRETKEWISGGGGDSDIQSVLAESFEITKEEGDWATFAAIKAALRAAGITGMSDTKLGKELKKITGHGSTIKKVDGKAISVRLGIVARASEVAPETGSAGTDDPDGEVLYPTH